MRVLHILDHSIPLHSGYAFRTLALLKEQRGFGWETFHLTSPKHTQVTVMEEDVDGWHFFRTAPASGSLAQFPVLSEISLMNSVARRLEEVAAQVRPDILHAHSPVLNAIPALWAGKRLGLPVVYEVRAFWEDAAVDHGTSKEWGVRYRLTRGLETYALKRADAVTTICEGLKNDIAARGIPSSRITVIPNAVDVDRFEVNRTPDEALKQELGLSGHHVLGFIGSFYAYEGLDILIRALPAILAVRPDVKVLLVGGGPQDEFLRGLARRLRVDEAVVFTGRVPHTDVQRYYDLIDILTYPRHAMRLTDLVTPLKPLEAMAGGRLLIASDVGGHRELIRDGETGLLFESGSPKALADTVLGLLAQPDRWGPIQAAGRRFVETERTWQKSAERYKDIYTRLVGQEVLA